MSRWLVRLILDVCLEQSSLVGHCRVALICDPAHILLRFYLVFERLLGDPSKQILDFCVDGETLARALYSRMRIVKRF